MRPRRVDVVVVSGDDEFLIEIGPLFSEGFRSRPVDSPAAIATVLAAQGEDSPPTMIMLDAAAVGDPRAAVAQMEAAHPNLPIIVAAASRDESYWSAAIARGAIIDVVARYDLGTDKFKDVLNRAEARARSAPQSAPPGEVTPPAKNNSKLLIAAAVAVVLAAGAFFALHKSGSSGPTAPTAAVSAQQSSAASATKPMSTIELLSAARIAFRDQKLLPRDGESHGDSALELYSQVLAQEPKNDEAIDGMQRLFSVIKSRVLADLASNKLDDAQRLIGAFKATNVESDGVKELDAQVAAARPKFYAARAQEMIQANDFTAADAMITQLATLDRKSADELRRTMESRKLEQATQAQLTQLAASVKQAIDAGNLLEPANDSARSRLSAMRQVSRNHPLTMSAQRDLQAALINRAQEQSNKDQFDAASKLIAAAGEVAATAEVAEAKKQLQGQIDAANQRAAAAAAARKAAEAAQAAAKQQDAAASAAAAAGPAYIAARPTTPLRVVYPSAAADNRVQGYVIVEFMLQADGRPAQPSIAESNPARIFDAAAIDAVMGAKYDTSKLTDKQPRRARVRLTFKPS
ncbi:MAG TPA: energy transducer TonB [Steroidobacteraceae bacterium]|nr:energy transducer TonB [Steroidobacteraceae bacterium]